MTHDELRARLARRAYYLKEWFEGTLEVREERGMEEVKTAKLSCIKLFYGDASSCHDDNLLYLWEMVEDDLGYWGINEPSRLRDSLGLTGSPRWEFAEFALVVGLILAEEATECFNSQSHKRHLLAAHMLADATGAQDYWISCAGRDRCRNPDSLFVEANNQIQQREKRQWFRERQSKMGRASAEARHSMPGGSREKQEKIRQIWATGKFTSRDVCAEQECAGLGMSFSTARKALRNTPTPD